MPARDSGPPGLDPRRCFRRVGQRHHLSGLRHIDPAWRAHCLLQLISRSVWNLETGHCDHAVAAFEHRTPSQRASLRFRHSQSVVALAANFASGLLLSGSLDGFMKVWRIADMVSLRSINHDCAVRLASACTFNHNHKVTCVSLRGSRGMSGTEEGHVRLFDMERFACVFEAKPHVKAVTTVLWVPLGPHMHHP